MKIFFLKVLSTKCYALSRIGIKNTIFLLETCKITFITTCNLIKIKCLKKAIYIEPMLGGSKVGWETINSYLYKSIYIYIYIYNIGRREENNFICCNFLWVYWKEWK